MNDSREDEIQLNWAKHGTGRAKRKPSAKSALQRIPRIARLMALAIKFQHMIDRGEVRDYADLARVGYVTRARVTQIMNLLHLAPDIQEQILLLELHPAASRPVAEQHIRRVVSAVEWCEQRQRWSKQ